MTLKFSNNGTSTLASSITSSQTTLTLQAGTGVRLPTLAAGDYFMATIVDTAGNMEIVRVTARSADTLTATRGQEGTLARAFDAGSYIANHLTAGQLATFFNTDNDGAGSGLDADLLDGLTQTASNTADTIVRRDGFGDFAARVITAQTFTGALSGNVNGNVNGNASTATKLSGNRFTWSGDGVLANVVGQLAWRNYGNDHTIFDASAGVSPDGTGVNNTSAAIAWSPTYPTLMGWNGAGTYGVRVDSARRADSAATADDSSHNHNAQTIALAFNAGGLQSLGTSGYQRLPGGLIIQWGLSENIPNTGDIAVTLPIAFPTAFLNLSVTGRDNGAFGYNIVNANIISTTKFTATAASNNGAVGPVYYIAIGY